MVRAKSEQNLLFEGGEAFSQRERVYWETAKCRIRSCHAGSLPAVKTPTRIYANAAQMHSGWICFCDDHSAKFPAEVPPLFAVVCFDSGGPNLKMCLACLLHPLPLTLHEYSDHTTSFRIKLFETDPRASEFED
jgi:hypothetical protein